MGTVQAIPMGLDDFVQGGLFSDKNVEVINLQFRGFDYGGTTTKDALSVWMQLAILDEHGKRTDEEMVEQYWSAGGDLEEVNVSSDGYMLLPGSNKSAMTKNSNWHILLSSFASPVNGGAAMPKDYLSDGNISKLKGLKFHLIRMPAPKREGLDTSSRKRKDYEQTVAVANQILAAPWGKGTAGGKTKAAAATTTTTAAAGGAANGAAAADTAASAGTADDTAKNVGLGVLKENPMISHEDFKLACFRAQAKVKLEERNATMKLLGDLGWLKTAGFKVAGDGDEAVLSA